MSLYHLTVPHFEKALKQIDRWIDKTQEHAAKKSFEANTLLSARLAPDQFPLSKQIQVFSDNAKLIPARVTGKEAPSHPDTEKTWDELRSRVHNVLEYLSGFKPTDFEGSEGRLIALPWMPGKVLTAKDYVLEFALPNFYFHYTTAYSILRHNGVELGKADFIGALPFRDA